VATNYRIPTKGEVQVKIKYLKMEKRTRSSYQKGNGWQETGTEPKKRERKLNQ
jgi:hypothetical protein